VLIAVCAIGCCAANIDDQKFNGRWDISVNGAPPQRAWWLEVSGAGTPALKGKFVGSPVGLLDEIPKLSISDGEHRLALDSRYRKEHQQEKGLYWARLDDGKLKGTFEIEGDPSSYLEWIGVRAPVIPDKDDGTWKRSDPVVLFDGRDLSGWLPVGPVRPPQWAVKDGLLTNAPAAQNLVSEKKFWNFSMDVEYRVAAHSNSGIALRGRYEVQVLDDVEKPPSNRSSGAILSRIAPALNASKAAGEWQTLSIRLVGRQVTVVHNGVRVIDKQIIEGPTAIALDANESDPGPIMLQGDRGPVEFRKIVVYPLIKAVEHSENSKGLSDPRTRPRSRLPQLR
jgi:hypothetical protein